MKKRIVTIFSVGIIALSITACEKVDVIQTKSKKN